ncbi:MAG: DNA mismatch repair endonuclease MutL [Muribaculaceae bacterium]|nr:DNA mismatch repair endonuclease MutL [Muribaculaceae bacterium]
MSDVIKLLPDSVANQIAAGEVIQRPASAIKELVENAVDAGARSIKIIIKDGGRTLIQVVDDGCGMSASDARLAFERHSTSKINVVDDLYSLHTMGFRGEALASICAVAQVELITKPENESLGTRIIINGSKVELQEPCSAAKGSNMMVKNLFFNVPARRKFLKKDSVELSNIIHEFERLVLVNPDIDFELSHNGTMIHQLLRGSLKMRIGQLFGKTVERQLIPIEVKTALVSITGFTGLPENARKRGALQYLFVNGRNMRAPYFHKAIMTCYENLIAPDVQPNYFLNFTVDPSTIDVNIHPTKNEIKFENEQAIFQILAASIRESLGKFNAVPSIDFNTEDSPEIPTFNPDSSASHELTHDTGYNPFSEPLSNAAASPKSSVSGSSFNRSLSNVASHWDKLYEGFERRLEPSAEVIRGSAINSMLELDDDQLSVTMQSKFKFDSSDDSNQTGPLFQLKNKYIVSPSDSGLLLVDQHRAHQLILFNKYMESASEGKANIQQLLFPEPLTLTAAQCVVLDSIVDNLKEVGFELTQDADTTWSITGVPSLLDDKNPVEALVGILDRVMEGADVSAEDLTRTLAMSLASTSAISSGKSLNMAEMEHLMSELMRLEAPTYTPSGTLVMKLLPFSDITKMFE